MIRTIIQRSSAGILLVVFCCSAFADQKPNVLLIMTDDQGWGDVGVHGNDVIQTPVLDKLAAESVTFDRFYVSPVCAPTRASLLSGRYDIRTGVSGVTGRREVMASDEQTIAEVLKSAGYDTGCFGKWHNGKQFPNDPTGQGFDTFFGFKAGHWNNYFDSTLIDGGKKISTEGYITDVLTDAALKFVSADRPQPFFCYVPYNAPHTPWQVPDRWFDQYEGKGLDRPTQSAYAMVSCIDHNIGRLLKTLEETGQSDNTIVIFLTDNGPNGKRYNGNMRGAKGSVHEGGCRVPLFIRWPGRLKPHDVDRIAAHVDLLPTLVELCGVPFEETKPRDGRSLVPLMTASAGDFTAWLDRNLYTYRRTGTGSVRGAIRNQRFRFVVEKQSQLYDMRADPSQKTDISKASPKIFDQFQRDWDRYVNEVKAMSGAVSPIPIDSRSVGGIELPAVEATFEVPAKFYNGQGWAHDWLTNISSAGQTVRWELDVVTAGTYDVQLKYAWQGEGSWPMVSLAQNDTEGTSHRLKPFGKDATGRPERDTSKGERWTRDFRTISLGSVILSGQTSSIRLQLRQDLTDPLQVEGLILISRD